MNAQDQNSLHPVRDYVRANYWRWARRWIGIYALMGPMMIGSNIAQYGYRPHMIPGMIATVLGVIVFAMIMVWVSLVVAGYLKSRGVVFPEWLTRERG